MDNLNNLYEVWHRTVPTFRDNDDATLAAFPMGFTHVADVTTHEVERVFQLTNTIDRGWWTNPEVSHIAPVVAARGGARSTSVGDVIVKALAVGADASGRPIYRHWSVQGIGLREF